MSQLTLLPGEFVELRGKQWLVESVRTDDSGYSIFSLSAATDDSQGERLEVIEGSEIDLRKLDTTAWSTIGTALPDPAEILAAYLRTMRWRSATAADRDLLQSPFRAGIRMDAYQLLPLRKALRLPRVNLLIADDVGLGKTIEAGLIIRELLLRRRIDFVLIAAPPAMTLQWKDELEAKFGLTFEIIDRENVHELRRQRGYTTNPWRTGSNFIISHRLLNDEVYMAGLRDTLGEFRPRALFLLDEAHHAAPSAGANYAVSSQLTRAVREISPLFEHRLFLTATPHNGHSNSFSALLEMLDPQRFLRGTEVRPKDLEPVMVRRLKSDLRQIGQSFPERVIEPILLTDLPPETTELTLAQMLQDYGELRNKRIATMRGQKAALAKLAYVGLQQRLLSSVSAFAKTLRVHRETLVRIIEGEQTPIAAAAVNGFVRPRYSEENLELVLDEKAAEQQHDDDEASLAQAATALGSKDSVQVDLKAELTCVDAMLAIAEPNATKPDARVRWLRQWIDANLMDAGKWNRRRLIIFTEYETTRLWLERRLREHISNSDQADERISIFTGITGQDRREAVKRAFNTDPDFEPLRILICTDAAREGINLQSHCSDLMHFDLPWNPSRLEQRNGRIDRKLQPAKQVFCRYFRYVQREADIVLDALVRKTETIREELGSFGQVIEERIERKLAESGIERGKAAELAAQIAAENDAERVALVQREMDDEQQARNEKLLREQADLQKALEQSRERVGVSPHELEQVAAAALTRNSFSLNAAKGDPAGDVQTFKLDPDAPAFSNDAGWRDALDDLRSRPRKRGETPAEWRRNVPVRSISFQPPILADGRDASDVVQVHLEHRLVRRLLSRFISQGFQSGLSRLSIIYGTGAQPRVVLMGRLSVYGPGATRLHEEIIPVTAIWSEVDREKKPLRALGESGEEKTMQQMQEALQSAKEVPADIHARIQPLVQRDIEDLKPTLESISTERLREVEQQLRKRGEDEARSLASLLEQQRERITKENKTFDTQQLSLDLLPDERKEREANRKHWDTRLVRLEREQKEEPTRLREAYEIKAHRLEPVGLVYLWPVTG